MTSLFSSFIFSWRESVTTLLPTNSSQTEWPSFIWYFPIPSWNHNPVRSEYFLQFLFPHSSFCYWQISFMLPLCHQDRFQAFGVLFCLVTLSSYRWLPQKCHANHDLWSRYGYCAVLISGPGMKLVYCWLVYFKNTDYHIFLNKIIKEMQHGKKDKELLWLDFCSVMTQVKILLMQIL